MSTPHQQSQDVVVILDPGNEAFRPHLSRLEAVGIGYRVCTSIQEFCIEFVKPDVFCGMVPEGSLNEGGQYLVKQVVELQPSWCDVPLFVVELTGNAGVSAQSENLEKELPGALYLSAPVSEATFVSVVQLAQRHRTRQLQSRDQDRVVRPAFKTVDASGNQGEVSSLGRPIQVLLVDDHEIVLKGLRGVMAFYRDIEIVGEARSGIEAMTKAEELQPQVIIMDVNMPMGNGIEVTRAIKDAFPGITIIGLSVYNDSSIIESMREAGADAFLEKGIDENIIHAAIQAHTQRVGQGSGN